LSRLPGPSIFAPPSTPSPLLIDLTPTSADQLPQKRKSERILDPLDRISEIIFGLIMALSFTGSLSVASAGRGEVRTMLIGALGCNTAWGIVDGVMFVLGKLLRRNRLWIQRLAVRSATDPVHGRRILMDEISPEFAAHLLPSELERVRAAIAAESHVLPKPGITGRDLLGAVAVFLLCFLSTLPVALPFALISDPARAVRTSNVIAMGMLFLAGHRLGKFAGIAPWKFGFVMLLLGVLLVLVTLALGG